MELTERFLQYVQIETTSDESCPDCPSSAGQWDLAKLLVQQLKDMGVQDARVDEHCYVYGTVPAKGDHPERIGLIAHMDTSDGVKGPTHPQVIRNYDGKAITLKNGVVIDGFSFLPRLKGNDLIVTDGTSVLGGDDKAGVAEIMQLVQRLTAPDAPEHCTLCVGFTPDEEVGRGADLFDVKGFGADFAYTVDGGELGEVEYENFNAASCRVLVHGVNIHPGSAKNQMKNALLIGMEFNSMLPPFETPAHTELREGFYHLMHMTGDEELTDMRYIIRDHSQAEFERRKAEVVRIGDFLNARYGEGTVEVIVKDSYRNMQEIMLQHQDVLDRAADAFRRNGVEPVSNPVRGGTDGARLSFMGLPCPNLSTGGYNFHSRKELVSINQMEKMVDVLQSIITGC